MTLYSTVCYGPGKHGIEEIDSTEIKRLGKEHICFDDDLFCRYKNGSFYGNIYDGRQLYADKSSCFAYWYQRQPITDEERELVKKALGATNF